MSALCRDSRPDRTDRPDGLGLPTVGEVLRMDSLLRGVPQVCAGRLDVGVRWVHVSDSDRVSSLLNGGELLLTTGAGWAGSDEALRRLVDELVDAGLAGIILELGTRFITVPPALVDACRVRELALVVLAVEVKFVTVTEQVHRRIIAGQLEALEQRQRLHELFTALTLSGASADIVVRETARVLGAPVVLENLAHEIVVADTRDAPVASLLGGWARRSRTATDLPDWTAVPVEARGVRWGTLIALAGAAHPTGRATVLEQASIALALGRLADRVDEWEQLASRTLVAATIGSLDVSVDDTVARLEAGGFPARDRTMHVLASAAATQTEIAGAAEVLRQAIPGIDVRGAVSDGEGVLLLSLPPSGVLSDALLRRAAAQFQRGIALGAPAGSVHELLASVPAARLLARHAADGAVRSVDDRPLTRLIAQLHGDHRVQEHSERMLAPLIRHDLATGGDLVRVLRAVVAHPGNRTAAAAASHLSRSVFYQRLALIGDLLDADLDDGETLTALHLALLAHAG